MEDDKYNISNYSDTELYDILDLNNPSDRELEAKLIHMINKYGNMQNESGYKLAIFFQNIYTHFFEIEEDVEPEPIQEGFETNDLFNLSQTNPTKYTDNSGNNYDILKDISGNYYMKDGVKQYIINQNNNAGIIKERQIGSELVNKNTNKSATATDIVNTTNFNYTEDNFGLNPLLKQTITRIISIDSQYRDNKSTTLATNFTLNLSEPLRGVVSLKLESIQIPITWYTISTSYGANFFMIKGRTDGINSLNYNGYHDYQISISPGNYVLDNTKQNYICTALNNTITDLSNTYTDVKFGKTAINYNTSTVKTTITLDLQKSYNESCFYLDFSGTWTPSTNSTITDQTELNTYRTQSIPSYLGLNNISYTPYVVRSNQAYQTNSIINKDIIPYIIDNSNNSFQLIQYTYDGKNEYTENNKITSFQIQIPIGTYNNSTLYSVINTLIQQSNFLDSSYSGLTINNITDPSNINFGYSYYELKIKLNRYTVKPIPNTKIIVIFPDESKLNRNSVWTITSQEYQSCFFFDSNINEMNIIYSESSCVESNITVDNYTSIFFKCISPPAYATTTDFSFNDILITIPQNNYSISQFITTLNNLFSTKNTIFTNNTKSVINNNYFNLDVDIINIFNSNNWSLYIDKSSALTQVFGISGEYKLIDYSNNNYKILTTTINSVNPTIYTTSPNPPNYNIPFSLSSNSLLTFYPNKIVNSGNKNDSSYNLFLSKTSFSGLDDFIQDINKQFNTFTLFSYYSDISVNEYVLSNSSITASQEGASGIYNISMITNINYYLTENNYEIYFNDNSPSVNNDIKNSNNSWYVFNIDYSYNILYLTESTNTPAKTIIGKSVVNLISLSLTNDNNYFYILPTYDNGGAYTESNYFKITVPLSTIPYTSYTLIEAINLELSNNPKLVGSYMTTYSKNNKLYLKFIININIIYTSKDYDIIFYDTTSFVKCFIGANSVQNTSWDSTLGWVLGFRDYTDYTITKTNQTLNTSAGVSPYYLDSNTGIYLYEDLYPSNNILSSININTLINLTGDTSTTTNIYNYFLIVVDDYIQNHLNDGLVSITSSEINIPLPSYSSKQTTTLCDPFTNTPVTTSTTNTDGLTQKQIYALNQAAISQKQNKNNIYSAGPNVQDVFGIIPLRIAGQAPGTYYVETGGNLQNQSRVYFGPVNISRLTIKLQNDKGDIVDLNGSNWSFSLLCEQLYRNK